MKLEKILKLTKSKRPILNCVNVTNTHVISSNIDTTIILQNSNNMPTGLYQLKGIDKCKISTNFDIDSYPIFNIPAKNLYIENSIQVDIAVLKSLYDFMSKDETRPFLNGISFRKNALCATDGIKLGRFISDNYNFNSDYILPSEGIKKAIEIFKKGFINIHFTESYAVIERDDITILALWINRDFPKYDMLFSNNYKIFFNISQKDLKEYLEKCILDSKNIKEKTHKITLDNNYYSINYRDMFEMSVVDDLLSGNEEVIEINFFNSSLLALIKIQASDTIEIKLQRQRKKENYKKTPIYFKCGAIDGVIMPVTI